MCQIKYSKCVKWNVTDLSSLVYNLYKNNNVTGWYYELFKENCDNQLSLKLDAFGGAFIIGPKGCGKTTTAKQKAKSFIEFQDEDKRENYLSIANTHPSELLKCEKPRLFDEWQDAPKIWGLLGKILTILEKSVNTY